MQYEFSVPLATDAAMQENRIDCLLMQHKTIKMCVPSKLNLRLISHNNGIAWIIVSKGKKKLK